MLSRKAFLCGATAGTLPLFGIGGAMFGQSRAKRIAAGAKIRLGVIGCGGRMCGGVNYGILNSMCADCEVICASDPDPRTWNRPSKIISYRTPSADTSKIHFYNDWREMLDKEGERLDAVAIATPNHHHATAAIRAMKLGLHVYVEKPMALTIEEVVKMRDVQRETGVVAQVGNQGHSEEGMRVLVECIRAGMIGQVHDVWCYNDRLNAMLMKPPAAKSPAGMDWDAWCGPAPMVDYYASTADHGGMHPHDWHSWIGYGNGSIGNMGTHIIDPVFWALNLNAVHPETIVANECEWGCAGSWTWRTQIDWTFPARPGMDPLTLHWYDGVNAGVTYDREHVDRIGICTKREYQYMPEAILEAEKRYGVDLGNLGTLFVGEKGSIKIGPHGNALIFMPKDLKKKFGKPPKLFVREKGLDHQMDWIRSIRNPKRPCGCNFGYSAPLATTVLFGNVAPRVGRGKKLIWDGTRIVNDAAANAFLKTSYRAGWEL